MKPLKIALVGKARSGKDTTAQLIRYHNGFDPFLVAFGDELKRRFHQTFPDILRDPKPRSGYLYYGQACRSIDPMVWIKALARRVESLKELGYESFIITDLRQMNEATWARENGYILVRVRANEQLMIQRSQDDKEVVLVNETEEKIDWIQCDYIIDNNGSIDDLENSVLELMGKIKGDI